MGVHGTSIAFMNWQWPPVEDWPEFGHMIGTRGAFHRDANERAWIKIDDADHPLNRAFAGEGFEMTEEFFRFHEPYSRQRVRVLLSMDTVKTDLSGIKPGDPVLRPDKDYALAWVRTYGRGRVFYATMGHNPQVFWNPKMLQFYLDASQFVLGDLPAPTTPSAKLSPAILAQEKLGWRLGVEAYTFHKFTFFETIEKTAELGLPYIGGLSFLQPVSKDIPKNFDQNLTDDELRQIRFKMESGGVRMLTYYAQDIPTDDAGCRRLFEFGRKMGFETFICEPKPEHLDLLDTFANEYGINVAIHNHGKDISPLYWRPEGVLKACEGRSKRIGAAPDLGYWLRSGIDPIDAVRVLRDRVITVQMHDLHEPGRNGHDVPWGTGIGKSEEFFRELHRQGIKPTMIGLEYSHDWFESTPKLAQCIEFFNATTLNLAAEDPDATGRATSAETVQDADGNIYHTVKIGNQVWTVENLRTTKYNDGTPIPHVTGDAEWKALASPGFCYYENRPANGEKYGALYNWWAASSDRIAPKRWKVPTHEEQMALRDYLIANGYNHDGTKEGNKVAKAMTAKTDWDSDPTPGNAGHDLTNNNRAGFTALPAGSRWNDGSFHAMGKSVYWWSTTKGEGEGSHMSSIHSRFAKYGNNQHHDRSGFCIRLLRDADESAQASSIRGTVKDSSGAGLAGACVKVESTGQSTTTDANGNFSMVLVGLAPVAQTVTDKGYIDYRRDVITVTKEGYLDYQIHVPGQDTGEIAIEMIDCAGTVTDADGNVYQTVKIGDFVWTTTGLKTTKYSDGTPIPNVTDDKEWQALSSPAWCYNENKPENGKNGLLYNWWAASHPRIAPKGWHVPSVEEQLAFRRYLVRNGYNFDGTQYPEWKGDYNQEKEKENKLGKSVAGRIGWQYRITDKSGNVWEKELLISERPELNNKTGFNCLPNGARWCDGSFHNLTGSCYMWSSTPQSSDRGWLSSVHNWSRYLGDSHHVKPSGFGIRLLRDKN